MADTASAQSTVVVTVIDPSRKRGLLDVAELWRYREVVFFLAWRDFKVRYRQTYLGVLWALLQPLVAMSVFSVFFGKLVGISSNGAPYPLFVLCGLLPWNFFSRAVGSMTGSLVSNQELVKRVYFPRLIIPTATMATCSTDLVIGFALLFIALLAFGRPPVRRFIYLAGLHRSNGHRISGPWPCAIGHQCPLSRHRLSGTLRPPDTCCS